MQDKNIEGNTDYETYELQNYIYTVTNPKLSDLTPVQPWADLEFTERINPPLNPGTAWKQRAEVWTEFMHDYSGNNKPTFSYTYGERINHYQGLDRIIGHLKKDPGSRQLFLSVWDPEDIQVLGTNRVPCTLGYIFQARPRNIDGIPKLDITYLIRSNDFITHFQNDVYLTHRLQKYVADQVGLEVGNFTHFAASLHIYRKDGKGVF